MDELNNITIKAIVPNDVQSIKVKVYVDGEYLETVILDKECNFNCMYPYSDSIYTIDSNLNIKNFKKIIEGTTIEYIPFTSEDEIINKLDTLEESVVETQLALAEVYEELDSSSTMYEEALTEIYEMIIE